MFTIYCHTNKINGKRYVGQTMQSLRVRWNGHKRQQSCPYFRNALQKYGADVFETEVLSRVNTKAEADQREIFWITFLGTTDPNRGYNLARGGGGAFGYKHTPEQRAQASARRRGRKLTPEHRANVSAALLGKKKSWTKEWRAAIGAARRGKKHSPEHNARIAASLVGRVVSLKTRKKIGDANRGRKVSLCTRQKQSEFQRSAWTPKRRADQAARLAKVLPRFSRKDVSEKKVEDLYKTGFSAREIGRQLNCSRDTVLSRLKASGLKPNPSGFPKRKKV